MQGYDYAMAKWAFGIRLPLMFAQATTQVGYILCKKCISNKLKGGDLRSKGKSEEVVAENFSLAKFFP